VINLLVNLLILCLIVGVFYWVATLVSGILPPPLRPVPLIIVALVALVLILNVLGVAGQPMWHVRL